MSKDIKSMTKTDDGFRFEGAPAALPRLAPTPRKELAEEVAEMGKRAEEVGRNIRELVQKAPRHVPFLMSTAMVQAILAGRKTQTRRDINPQPFLNKEYSSETGNKEYYSMRGSHNNTVESWVQFAKARPGDLIYVREVHYAYGRWVKNGISETGRQKWKFKDETLSNGFHYQYADTMRHKEHVVKRPALGWHKRPSMFMPKAAARIWLRCTGVKAERVQDISEVDAIAEGIYFTDYGRRCGHGEGNWKDAMHCEFLPYAHESHAKRTGWHWEGTKYSSECYGSARHAFGALLNKVNGRDVYAENPWVWAYSFEVLSTTGFGDALVKVMGEVMAHNQKELERCSIVPKELESGANHKSTI